MAGGAYTGYLRYGGTEVSNLERLSAYIANGIAPTDVTFDLPEFCDGLAKALAGDTWHDYRSPLLDAPPWFDPNDPASLDFAGVLILDITGLAGSTRTVDMVPTVRDGALPGTGRRGPRTAAVSALLIGRSTEGVNLGFDWLTTVLHGSCEGTEALCGPTATLECFTVCPGPIYPTVNINGTPIVATQLDPNAVGGSTDWYAVSGDFVAPAPGGGTVLAPYEGVDHADAVDAREADNPPVDVIDGGGALLAADLVDGGDAQVYELATLTGAPHGITPGPVTITWHLHAPGATDAVVRLALVGPDGIPFEEDISDRHVTTVGGAYVMQLPDGVMTEGWRAALISQDDVVVTSLTVQSYPLATPYDCISPYWRFLPGTATVAGPTVAGTFETDDVTLLKVEWTWVVGSPYRYGVSTTVLGGLAPGVTPPLVLEGVTSGDSGVISATPWNCTPPTPPPSCALDPVTPGLGNAPALPAVTATGVASITTQQVRSMWVCVGPEQIPVNDGTLTISLTTSNGPVVGARVRVWDDAQGDCTVPSNCDFAYEYLIDYIPDDAIFTIDGVQGGFTTLCDFQGVPQVNDASTVVRGDFGGPTKEPAARCNRRYLILVQWLDTYPRSSAGLYTAGGSEGDLSVSVAVTPPGRLMQKLGNGENRAYIYDRLGQQQHFELALASVEWGRSLCDISRPTVTVAPAYCQPKYDKIHPWAHSLVIYRDGDRVHEGPIRKRTDKTTGLTLTSSDVLGWTERRPLRDSRTLTGTPILTEALWTVQHAFAPDDPNVLAYVQTLGVDPGRSYDRDSAAASATCASEVSGMVGTGLRYTVLGRAILLWAGATIIGRTQTLVPELHLLTDVDVIEDGDTLGTEVTARDDNGAVAHADGGTPVDPFYGLVSLLVATGSNTPDAYAAATRDQAYPAPVIIDVPSDAALACDSPFPISQLVPGVLVPVETVTATRRKVSGTFVLSAVKVTQTAGQDEKVSITLAPVT